MPASNDPRAPDGRPILALTMGDPCGIGPEITLRALARPDLPIRPVVLGDLDWLKITRARLGLALEITSVAGPAASRPRRDVVEVLEAARVPRHITVGEVDAAAGGAAYACVRRGIELAMAGEIAGLVTAPVNKTALAAAGVPFPGHTEMLAHHADVPEVAMMLTTPELRVVLVSIHVSLAEAARHVDRAAELRAIRFAHDGARALGIERPRIGVAGLNPHAGEGGLFGDQEREAIAPAIAEARAAGYDAIGPWSGDAIFRRARAGDFDVVVAQYHDQGLIPIKLLSIADGVNVTLGLPFVRTSPDHGTAFDIAPAYVADESSLVAAIEMAAQLARSRHPWASSAASIAGGQLA